MPVRSLPRPLLAGALLALLAAPQPSLAARPRSRVPAEAALRLRLKVVRPRDSLATAQVIVTLTNLSRRRARAESGAEYVVQVFIHCREGYLWSVIPEEPLQPENGGPTRLLLVDDEPDLLSTLGEILQDYGFAVVSTWEGEEAIEIASLFKPQVIVTDFQLPGMDGVTTIERVREARPSMKAILVSGHISGNARRRAQQQQVDSILEKPLSVPELLRNIRVTGPTH